MGKCNPKSKIFPSFTISGIEKVESHTFYRYEYEYKICLLYETQAAAVNK